MAASWRKLKAANTVLIPQLINVKQGRLGKLRNIIVDYRNVFIEIARSVKQKPLKSFLYLSGLSVFGYMWTNNPDQKSYVEQLTESSNEILLISDAIRSKESNRYVRHLMDLYTRDCLVWQSFGFFTLALKVPFGKELDLYEKHCYYVQPRWLTIKDRIVDIGFCGQWFNLKKAMVDFDVNEDEFDQET